MVIVCVFWIINGQQRKKMKINKSYRSIQKKTGTKIYGRTSGDRRDEPDTTTLVVVK